MGIPSKRKPPAPRSRTHWMDMINKPREPPKPVFEESTMRAIATVAKSFHRFVQVLEPADPHHWLENVDLNVLEAFLRWYLEGHKVVSLDGFLVKARFFRLHYCYTLGHEFPYALKQETRNACLICGQLKEEYDLNETKRFQPPVNADDLFSKLYFDLAISDVYFPTERQRTQHETMRKIDDLHKRTARNSALGLGALLMRARHRLNKGKRNKGRAFSYFERNDNLGMCVIQDVLQFAFEDGAFSSNRIQEAQDIWRYTAVPAHRKSVPIHIKKEMERIPIFRCATRDKAGNWITQNLFPVHSSVKMSAGVIEPGARQTMEVLTNIEKVVQLL
ncbi:hypothetical protein ACJ73_05880 [Blastomyces percursus]|uniref:Uncharacterized protein n=1 Tax=Blastomyces percursus TaxID=1658174 RepID=A0A1J9Q2L5_9EURO|nr:hypothetical protein ACJ73_05880 [Blastomyces percursus]